MEPLALIATILVIHILAWFTPGPLFVLIVRNSLVYSRKSGMWTAVGIGIGNFVHITSTVFAVSFLFSKSVLVFDAVAYLGALYLAHLGIKTLLLKDNVKTNTRTLRKMTPLNAVKTGFLTNLLSPKASLFFASVFTTVISLKAPVWALVFLWIAMPLNSVIMASLLSVFFTQGTVRLVYIKYQYWINKMLGLLLLALAVMIVLGK